MHGSIRIYSGSGDLADALIENESEVRQIISEIDGFKAYYFLRTGDGTASVSIFEDEAGAEESNKVAAAWIRDNVPNLSISAPKISAGEVVINI